MKNYAILSLGTLKIKYFNCNDEILTAIESLKRRNTGIIVLKWNYEKRSYDIVEVNLPKMSIFS